MDYVYINEVQGRSELGMLALGTFTLQDSLMFYRYGNEDQKKKYLSKLVTAEISPSFAMTEPDVVSSDPTGLQTKAVLQDGQWVINGRKWFTTGAKFAGFSFFFFFPFLLSCFELLAFVLLSLILSSSFTLSLHRGDGQD